MFIKMNEYLKSLVLIFACYIFTPGYVLEESSSTEYFTAYAPPSSWGPWTKIASHIGPTTYSISADPIGNTDLYGRVKYWTDDDQVIKEFQGSIAFTTGNIVGVVEVSFKGIPFGTAVKGAITP